MQATVNPTTTTDLAEIMVAEGVDLHTSIARADAALIAAGHRRHPAEIRVALIDARGIADIRMSGETVITETSTNQADDLADPQLSIAAAALSDCAEALTMIEGHAQTDGNDAALAVVDQMTGAMHRLGRLLGLVPA